MSGIKGQKSYTKKSLRMFPPRSTLMEIEEVDLSQESDSEVSCGDLKIRERALTMSTFLSSQNFRKKNSC